ncbi:TetR/AcrR family transcriptional regulator [Brevibacillus dissolubilis]|uniref:TetR/AcrR family transcriptional regulator n=1 Tax=Brevibacillus dissolubilis TaxID=1844116 RepID=UPI001116AD00|nr:TetR/AcrR family transcriptional regulator [Brevibacillus dissolubilis]
MPKVPDDYKEQRRAAILQSATHCFAEKGYQATTIDDIMRHAQVSKGAVYHYFKSKEEIYISLLDQKTEQSFETVRTLFASCPTAVEKLSLLFARYREQQHDSELRSMQAVQLEFWLYSSRYPEWKALMEKRAEIFFSFFQEILREGQKNGEFRPDINEQVAASLFWAVRDGIGLHFAKMGNEAIHERVWLEAERMVLGYLRM